MKLDFTGFPLRIFYVNGQEFKGYYVHDDEPRRFCYKSLTEYFKEELGIHNPLDMESLEQILAIYNHVTIPQLYMIYEGDLIYEEER